MAPILKEAETQVTTGTTSAPATPASKPPGDAPARPQPVAVEIPVTVNGARTVVVAGESKREPFSETTQTVLVFSQGAVIRTGTALAPGQLVFLTNEKTKKEVVCQVVKSKLGSTAGGYVELEFTEPSAGFWGLPVPAAATVAPLPPKPVSPAVPRTAAPAPPATPKPAAAKPAGPPAAVPPPAKPASVPTSLPAAQTEPTKPPVAATPGTPTPSQVTPPSKPAPAAPVSLAPPSPDILPTSPLRDHSREIEAIFAIPQAPPAQAVPLRKHDPLPAPAASSPSTEKLKLETARLQEQLSSLLFTEKPAAPQAVVDSQAACKPEPLAEEPARKAPSLVDEEAKKAPQQERKPAPPLSKALPLTLPESENVKIPSWLAPLSPSSESAIPASSESQSEGSSRRDAAVELEEPTEDSFSGAGRRSSSAVLSGPLLGESSAPSEEAIPGRSKTGWILAVAAVAALAAAGGGWYLFVNHAPKPSGSASPTIARQAVTPSSGALPEADSPSAQATSAPIPNRALSTPAAAAAQAPRTPLAETATQTDARNGTPALRNHPAEEPPRKPVLGDVHLGSPVVSRGSSSDSAAEPMPTIGGQSSAGAEDPLAGVTATHHTEPAAPLPVGGNIKEATLLKSVPPVYPQEAKSQHISGSVEIDALIDASGNVATAQVVSGPILLHRAALDAVRQWKYAPAELNGQPTATHLTITVQFHVH